MSYEQFLAWPHENTHVEWVDEKVIPMAPISDQHNELSGFLLTLLTHFVEYHRLGKLRYEPFQMKSAPDLPGRSPDILFISNANLPRLKKTHLEGPADLVIEIISPDSRARDRGKKFYEYEQAGVPEYWLLDPDRKQAEFYLRAADGIYRPAPTPENLYKSPTLPNLWLKVDWLFHRPLPTLMSILKEWKLI